MTSHLKLAGEYYHDRFPGSIIFYRLGDSYVAFLEDAQRAASILRKPIEMTADGVPSLSIVQSEYLDSTELLAMCNVPVHGIIYRNDDGEFDIPDVNLLKEEEEMDY